MILKMANQKKRQSLFIGISLIFVVIMCLIPVVVCSSNAVADSSSKYETILTDNNGRQFTLNETPLGPQPAIAVANVPSINVAGSVNVLTNVPAFFWSYGCSATSAGMLFGYYDRIGYSNFYTGPTNGGVCPLDNTIWGTTTYPSVICGEDPINATHQGIDSQSAKGHVDDYWIDYGQQGPDPWEGNWTEHTADCAGDYMGTNQWKYGSPVSYNTDGSTLFVSWTNGTRTTESDIESLEGVYSIRDGCHGMKLFAESCGYTVTLNYNQRIVGYAGVNPSLGFTFADFQAEIDAGYPVLIQVEGHTMLGYGYNTSGNLIYIHDTWDYSAHTMTWGGSYGGMLQYGVSVIHLAPIAYLTVTSPDGDEIWNALSTHTITWDSVGVTSNVKIELSRDAGSTWTTIVASTPNDGVYDWIVTGPYTTSANISISSVTTPTVNDTSDAVFTIFQSLTVTDPNGDGPGWDYNTTQTISWTSVGVKTTDKVKIELSRNGGAGPWETIVASTTNTGSKTWKVTGLSTSHASIKVSLVANAAVNDISDAVFSINPPTITLTSPLGTEVWDYNTSQNITWTTTGWASSDRVKIEISRDSGANWTVLYASVANTGSYTWKVVSPGSTNARIRVSLTTDPSVADSSGADFTIEPPHIFLDSPIGTEVWNCNTSQNITWYTTGFASRDKVKIEVSYNSGIDWAVLYASVSNTGVKTWKIASLGSTQARIRVSLVADPSVNDSSDADFTIVPPNIILDSPIGTEIWNCNTSQNITWHTTNFASKDKVKIEISRDGGANWTVLYASVPNTGLKLWKVTSPGSTNVRIKVSSTTDPSVTDMSDTDFTIVPPYIYLDSPIGGEGWDFNTSQNITWHATNFASRDKVKIEISRNGGANWTVLYASVANTGLKTWKVTGPSSPNCLIKVSLTTDPTVNDVSDLSFTINDPTITVVSPDSSSNWVVNTTCTIAWTSTGLTSSDKVKIEVSYDGGGTWTTIFASVSNTGSKTWKVVGTPTTTAVIRITSITYSIATDNSDVFTIST
jgi:hypothetical protein